MKRFFAALFAALLLTPVAWARWVEIDSRVFRNEPILTQASVSDAEKKTHDAILKGAEDRKWQVIQDTPTVLRLRVNVRNKHTVVVDVRIKPGKVDVDYVDSINMNYNKSQGTIHPNYHVWIDRLLQSARIHADIN
ncbi:MAG: hypothetical protein LBU76_04855 [Azoarcus sp.]|nr:hypothetical protein [Azoarcus sp.]